LGRDDVAGTQRRICRRSEWRQSQCVLAVAGAIGDQLFAIDEGRVESGIARAVAGNGMADFSAEEDRCGKSRPSIFSRP
jgi:hypothetical protein